MKKCSLLKKCVSFPALLLFVLIASSCNHDIMSPAPPENDTSLQPTGKTSLLDRTSEFPAIRRVDLEISANGPFRPGEPIDIEAEGLWNRRSLITRFELVVLERSPGPDDPLFLTQIETPGARDALERLRGRISFAHSGYYRVLLRAQSTPPVGESIDNVDCSNTKSE